MLRFLTAGESHGLELLVILEGLPAGIPIEAIRIRRDLARRQRGYGRGARMQIERDEPLIVAGVRHGHTLGSPVALRIPNLDHSRWETVMAVGPVAAEEDLLRRVFRPRPGHADLAGGLKYDRRDLRDILERASARETAARTAMGAVCRILLEELGVRVASHVVRVGRVAVGSPLAIPFERIASIPEDAAVGCADPDLEQEMIAEIDRARESQDSVNGAFEVAAQAVPPGLGSHVQWDRRLDGRLMQAVGSIPAVKAVSIGDGVEAASRFGSEVHDEIFYAAEERRFHRPTNRAGGIEGGITNGSEVRVTGYMKPLSTLPRPLRSIDVRTHAPADAAFERTDTTAIRAAGVIGEAMVAYVLADAMIEKFGGDSLEELRRNLAGYQEQIARY
jgi:chorismate synthase